MTTKETAKALLVLSAGLLFSSQSAAQTKPAFQVMDVFDLEWASDPQISPDGETIVYRRNFMDVMTDSRQGRLWLIDADGNHHVKLTDKDISEGSAVWSPDGTRLAYVSSGKNGNELD